ncbi:hypothetical protein L1276_001528 [Flavobacterium sp. HSC-32F16]|nr:hypothetical protein [Flavobacterium sp. HSC-32F16]
MKIIENNLSKKRRSLDTIFELEISNNIKLQNNVGF